LPFLKERRAALREPVIGCLWMIDGQSSTIMRCQCVDVSTSGMRLRVPSGYGVQEGQVYELTSHLPGQSSPPGFGLTVSRRAEVVRARVVAAAEDEYDMDVGVALASARRRAVGPGGSLSPSAWE
jgi:hypothetical protein